MVEAEQWQQQQQQQQVACRPCMHMFAARLLSTPGLVAALPEAVCAAMLRQPTLQALLTAAAALGQERTVSGSTAAALLGNISQLLLGKPGRQPGSDATELLRLPPSPYLAVLSTAAAFCGAVMQLLPAAAVAAPSRQAPLSEPESAVVRAQLALLGAQGPLLQLLGVLASEGMPLFAGYCLHLLQDLPIAEEQLSQVSPAQAAEQQQGNIGSSSSGGGAALNALAFAPQVLPALWRWLSVNLGLPTEAPAASRIGLDVESMAGGCRRLAPQHALVLGVFCR